MGGLTSVTGPDGRALALAATPAEEPEATWCADEAVAERLRRDGVAVVRRLLDPEACRALRDSFRETVKPHRGFLFRQTTGRPERNRFDEHGHLVNPIHDVQDVPEALAPFRAKCLEILSDEALHRVLGDVFGERARLVQTMIFEANTATPGHQDSYFLDSTRVGALTAAWIALEPIAAGAGRFWVSPGSHHDDLALPEGETESAFHLDRYLSLVADRVRGEELPVVAPALEEGDVLFWNSRTIHGSLPTTESGTSRLSLTAHFIPVSTGLLQLRAREVPLRVESVGHLEVHHRRDQRRAGTRLAVELAGRFPRSYVLGKRCAKWLLSH